MRVVPFDYHAQVARRRVLVAACLSTALDLVCAETEEDCRAKVWSEASRIGKCEDRLVQVVVSTGSKTCVGGGELPDTATDPAVREALVDVHQGELIGGVLERFLLGDT